YCYEMMVVILTPVDGIIRWLPRGFSCSPKYEEVYLKAYSSVTDAKKQLSAYFEFYNLKRPHSSLDKMTPNEFYYDQLPQQNKVA
ncbi:integrase core domain-containing protein, partial [Klebsiella pneumoniae]